MVSISSIVIRGLNFSYDSNHILHDIDLELEGAGLICIIGPNGVGKSTLIKCMNGLLKPTSGEIIINGTPISEFTMKELSEFIGYVPAASSLSFPMSVIDSILIGMKQSDRWRQDPDDVILAYRSLRVMRMESMALRNCNSLSAGQTQKVNICRGLVRDSEILILDEPTSNLDVKHQLFVADFLQRLSHRTGSLVIMISHDLNIAARFADNVVVMKEPGVVDSFGPPQDIISEEMIREVYSVNSSIIQVNGRPHVILDSAENW